jgi:ribosomal protein L37AE/L43A
MSEQSKANRALINDFRRMARSEDKCPNCGHWMRWSERLGLWRCSWCKTKAPPLAAPREET